ncbi:eukaryotic type KH-domain (KH-domain type I) [Apiospora marii]|uniref:Pre-rRNA-processing protein PNO1 n=1 Tax=Apiospora marii TaxID=335849 RepID=A0ABR1S7Z8_9PEZI
MPAPTAILQKPVEAAAEAPIPQPDQDDEVLLDATEMNSLDTSAIQLVSVPNNEAQMDVDEEGKPRFAPARDIGSVARIESRKVPIPPHRMSPLKSTWPKIYPVVVEHLNLAIRMNVKSKAVELRTTRKTTDTGALQKGADFITAFALGFDVDDAIALLRLDDLYIETFEIKDVKTLEGDHKARAIGRIAGQSGKTKYAIENASKTRIVLADSKVHILGGFKNIQIARTSIVSLIMGKQPGKVYNGLRTVAARMKERF